METKYNKVTSIWIITILVLFVLAIIFGILMRMNQGHDINLEPVTFYSLMTTHGLTMIGIWFVAGMAAVNFLMQRYVKAPHGANIFAMVLTVIGVLMLWATTFLGNFHTGWTFLYPLPFYMFANEWATPVFLAGLGVLGVAWFVWSLAMIVAIFKKYPITKALAWQHLSSKESSIQTPPFILISTVTLIGIIACLLTAVLLLVLFFAEFFTDHAIKNDPLLMKNLTFFFGHTLANEMLYLGVATLYEILPEVSGRPAFKTTWYVALAWNATMCFVLFAFFHHLYMDFVQPVQFQMIGQIASYLASLPAVSITIFSVLMLFFKNKVQWNLTNVLYFTGVGGWAIGGMGAVLDATIYNNFVLHNTLWVPAHFHSYNAMGNVLFSLAFFYWVSLQISKQTEAEKVSKFIMWTLLIGGAGFLIAFYIGGAYSVPRRYSIYPEDMNLGKSLASWGALFATIYLLGILAIKVKIVKRCLKAFTANS